MIVIKSTVEINTKITWNKDLWDPLSLRYKNGMKRIMDIFNDEIVQVSQDNGVSFERADVSFSPAKEGGNLERSGSPNDRAFVTIEFEFRRIYSGADDLYHINEAFNRHIISFAGDAIRNGGHAVLDTDALAIVRTKTGVYLKDKVMVTVAPTKATNIDFTIFTQDPCPIGDCWIRDYSTGICIPKTSCATVQCGHDDMFISFKPALFGIPGGSDPFTAEGPLRLSDRPKPTFDMAVGAFRTNCILGDCGMRATIDDGKLEFAWTWSTYGAIETKVEHFGSTVHSKAGAHVTWTCSYEAHVAVSSSDIVIDEGGVVDRLQGTGNLASGFALTLHNAPQNPHPLGDEHILGFPVYVRVQWSTRMKGVQFYVEECTIREGQAAVRVVSNNCYAKELGATLVGEHLQTRLAMFKYDSFTFHADKSQQQVLECVMNVCVDGQPCYVNKKKENCPKHGISGLFRFTLYGVPFQLPDVPAIESV